MSWMKGAQGGAPPPGPERQPYGAPQPYGNQQSMYNNYQSSPSNIQQQQQPQMWQAPPQPPQFNQQYGQAYQQQQGFTNNTNQFYHQQSAQFNQNYNNQNYSNMPQGYQQNYYPNQVAPQQNYNQNKLNSDSWEDNWDWGWDDASKQAQKSQSQTGPVQTVSQQLVCNNANVIEESFATTDSWNWSMEDKQEQKEKPPIELERGNDVSPSSAISRTNTAPENPAADNAGSDSGSQRSTSNLSSQHPSDEVRNLSDRDVVKECLPNLALGKRFNLENLTPQWSIESQMSQESSDGPLTQSEGTYRSENQSRNSSKSSPGLNTDNSNFNYSQVGYDDVIGTQSLDWSRKPDELAAVNNVQDTHRRDSHDELTSAVQEMSISNHEKLDPNHALKKPNYGSGLENLPVDYHTRNSRSPAHLNPSENQVSAAGPPAQSVSTQSVPPPPSTSTTQQPPANFVPASSSGAFPVLPNNPSPSIGVPPTNNFLANTSVSGPPPNFPPSSASSILPPANFPSQNPFKHAGPFSHKNLPKGPVGNIPAQPFSSPMANNNLSSPAVVSKVSQNRIPVGFGANLETTPDNSERPDQPQVSSYRPMPVSQQIPDNLEIAPQNDRNEYLQTAHLSGGDYGENTDFSREVPLTSLRRMGVGQQDTEYNQSLNISGDEPPPGLARMVPGQQTEADHGFNQPNDTYMDRQIDGQTTDRRPYRQAEGQQTPDYSQPPTSRGPERRPIGLDRMVPGEPSNDEFLQYQNPNYSNSNDQRVVTGVDHDYPMPTEAGHSNVREQNVDGSDYSEQPIRNPARDDTSPDYSAPLEEQQREVTMEGENLQDLSVISSAEVSYARDTTFGGANANVAESSKDRNYEEDGSVDCQANNSTRQSLNGGTSGEDSERDRTFKSSPRRDRDKRRSSKDHDHDRERDRDRARDREKDKEGRYSRSERDRKYDRDADRRPPKDDRRSDKDRRDKDRDRDRDKRDRGDSPDGRRYRRRGHRYETEDTDYYSDKERERRRYREGSSYKSSKPPRPDDKERERSRRYTVDREGREGREARDGRERRDRYAYRDIDPGRKHAKPRRERDDERRRVVTFSGDAKPGSSIAQGESYSSPSRAGSREATATDEDAPDERRRAERDERRRARSHRPDRPDPYYEGYDSYALQLRQYEYYERLRRADPAAYMRLYKQLMAGHAPLNLYGEGYPAVGYEALGARGEERGSVHSGRSSANGLKGNDTELTTDASLNLHLEESTVRSERMTPCKFSTAHIKGRLSARALVCVRAAYPVDGLPATVQLLPLAPLLAAEPSAAELHAYPGPLVKGVTHKKSVLDYCEGRARAAARGGGADPRGAALLWRLLALLLRQNGVVMGADIAELLMKNTREDEYQPPARPAESRRESSLSGAARPDAASSPDAPSLSAVDSIPQDEESSAPAGGGGGGGGEREAVDRLREHLLYGNRQEALEWAISAGLWGHALTLAAHGGRRARAAVAARFQASLPPADPLHTLYATLAAHQPPAATCVADERWGDWRPHAAIVLSNVSAKPEQDRRTLTQLGDTLASRGLMFSAQFCYLSAGVPLAAHPLAPLSAPPAGPAPAAPPPRLSLLLADPRAPTLQQFATNQAIFATEIYEYALSLSQDYVIDELQVYKLVLATRLVEAGLCERALRYAEQAARALARAPRAFPPALPARLAQLADRLKYFDPALQDDGEAGEGGEGGEEGGSEPSPRHQQWLADVTQLAHQLSAEASAHTTPLHHHAEQQADGTAQQKEYQQQQWGGGAWADQTLQQYQSPAPYYPQPAEDAADSAHYYPQPAADPAPPAAPAAPADHPAPAAHPAPAQQQYDYWQQDSLYGYGEKSMSAAEEAAPSITMPGSAPRRAGYPDYDDDRPPSNNTERDTDTPQAGGAASGAARGAAGGAASGAEARGAAGGEAGGARRGGWLGGLFTKLALRPPNQMILPDDKNPTIVWDEQSKRWRNTAGDGDDEPAPPPPPPPSATLTTSTPLQSPGAGAPPLSAPPSNMFKMQKNRHIKKSYVDVLNPGGAAPAAPAPPPALLPAPPAPAPPAYFVPPSSPVEVSIPSTPEESRAPTPAPLPAAPQGGIYDVAQVAEEEPYRSGI